MSWTPQNVLDAAGPQASSLVSLHWFLTITCAVVWALVIVALALAIRRRRAPDDAAPELPESENAKRRVVTAAAIVSVLILFAFFLASLLTGKALATPPSRNTLIVDITAALRVRVHLHLRHRRHDRRDGGERAL